MAVIVEGSALLAPAQASNHVIVWITVMVGGLSVTSGHVVRIPACRRGDPHISSLARIPCLGYRKQLSAVTAAVAVFAMPWPEIVRVSGRREVHCMHAP